MLVKSRSGTGAWECEQVVWSLQLCLFVHALVTCCYIRSPVISLRQSFLLFTTTTLSPFTTSPQCLPNLPRLLVKHLRLPHPKPLQRPPRTPPKPRKRPRRPQLLEATGRPRRRGEREERRPILPTSTKVWIILTRLCPSNHPDSGRV